MNTDWDWGRSISEAWTISDFGKTSPDLLVASAPKNHYEYDESDKTKHTANNNNDSIEDKSHIFLAFIEGVGIEGIVFTLLTAHIRTISPGVTRYCMVLKAISRVACLIPSHALLPAAMLEREVIALAVEVVHREDAAWMLENVIIFAAVARFKV